MGGRVLRQGDQQMGSARRLLTGEVERSTVGSFIGVRRGLHDRGEEKVGDK